MLAGGTGTRLRPYTTVLPKPLMPVGDMPVLEILLRRLAAAGFVRVNLAVGHLAELIEAYFGDGERFGVELVYWRESAAARNGRPDRGDGALTADRVLVMNGDLLTTLDFAPLRRRARRERRGGDARGALARGADRLRRRARRRRQRRVVRGEARHHVRREHGRLRVRAARRRVDSARASSYDFPDLLGAVLERGWPVHAHRSTDFWLDIGRIDDYELALERFDELRDELLPAQ